MKSNILVTGGAGYIGSTTCKLLKKEGYNPIVFDNLTTGSKNAIKWGIFVLGDIKDYNSIYSALKNNNISSVIHFAASISVNESVSNPFKYYENNVYGTLTLLKAMQEAGVKNIVFSSTAAVYGEPKHNNPIVETDNLKPINPYGNSKKICEEIIQDFYNAYGIKYSILRYFNACGAEHELDTGWYNKNSTNLIPIVTKAAANNTEFKIFGNDYSTHDGTCIRDYIHVQDLAIAHVKSLAYLHNNDSNLILNLGTGKGVSVLEIVNALEKQLTTKLKYSFDSRRKGDPELLIANPSLAFKNLSWQAKYNLKDIVTSAINWQAKHFN